jgi:hypothetical protein
MCIIATNPHIRAFRFPLRPMARCGALLLSRQSQRLAAPRRAVGSGQPDPGDLAFIRRVGVMRSHLLLIGRARNAIVFCADYHVSFGDTDEKVGRIHEEQGVVELPPRPILPLCFAGVGFAFAGLSGCGGGGDGGGGGGGGGGNPPPAGGGNPNLATVSGRVIDNLGNPVPGARVTIFKADGTVQTTQTTSSTGTFSVFNIPLTANKFIVNTPDITQYWDIVQYQGSRPYDTDPNRSGGPCRLPLPTLVAGGNALPADVIMYSANAGPPPPPSANCP